MRTIGEIIKLGRKRKNITQQQLAEMLSVKQTMISRWENGEQMHSNVFIKLVNALGIAADIFPGYVSKEVLNVPEGSPLENKNSVNYIDYLKLKWEKENLEKEMTKLKENEKTFLKSFEQIQKDLDDLRNEVMEIKKEPVQVSAS